MEGKDRENSWGSKRKVDQESAKKIDIWTERMREISNNGL
jgi:hypothetical protein